MPYVELPRNKDIRKDYYDLKARGNVYGGLKFILKKYDITKQRLYQIIHYEERIRQIRVNPSRQLATVEPEFEFIEYDSSNPYKNENWERLKRIGRWPQYVSTMPRSEETDEDNRGQGEGDDTNNV